MSRAWDNEKSESLTGFKPMTSQLTPGGWALYPLELQRTHEERGPILGSYLTLILPTAIYVVETFDILLLGGNIFICLT